MGAARGELRRSMCPLLRRSDWCVGGCPRGSASSSSFSSASPSHRRRQGRRPRHRFRFLIRGTARTSRLASSQTARTCIITSSSSSSCRVCVLTTSQPPPEPFRFASWGSGRSNYCRRGCPGRFGGGAIADYGQERVQAVTARHGLPLNTTRSVAGKKGRGPFRGRRPSLGHRRGKWEEMNPNPKATHTYTGVRCRGDAGHTFQPRLSHMRTPHACRVSLHPSGRFPF